MTHTPIPLRSYVKLTGILEDQALCYVQPVLLNGAEFGSATLSQFREASSDLLLNCASRARQGGIATHFGMSKESRR